MQEVRKEVGLVSLKETEEVKEAERKEIKEGEESLNGREYRRMERWRKQWVPKKEM